MRKRTIRTAAMTVGLGLAIGVGSPALAQERAAEAPAASLEADAFRIHPDRDHDLEVLHLNCEAREGTDQATRVRIVCRWREAQNERAAGYQLWRIVDQGERELVGVRRAEGRLALRDVVSAEARGVRYAVLALDEHGNLIGQSRVETIALG